MHSIAPALFELKPFYANVVGKIILKDVELDGTLKWTITGAST
jgi:hypothetical protein